MIWKTRGNEGMIKSMTKFPLRFGAGSRCLFPPWYSCGRLSLPFEDSSTGCSILAPCVYKKLDLQVAGRDV